MNDLDLPSCVVNGRRKVDLKDRWLPPRKAILHAVAMAPLVAIGVLSVVPGEYRPHVFGASQLEHMAAYIIVLFLGAYGAALEFCQIWIPGRNAALIDVAADVVGALIGIAVATMIAGVMPKLHAKLMISNE
jgi:hypothetical protein